MPEIPAESSHAALGSDALAELLGVEPEGGGPAARDLGARYSFRHVLGEGGQGVVVAAWDKRLKRNVALKLVRRPGQAEAGLLRREAYLAAALEHPNIPPAYDLGEDETGAPILALREVPGLTLEEALEDRARPLGRARLLQIFLQVAAAIEYAHSQGILHLDLKPANVRLGPFGEVYVLDWGFAARRGEPRSVRGGTPGYAAPEQLADLPVDERTDVYALGIMLYRLMTGRLPFAIGGLSLAAFREAFQRLIPDPPRRWAKDLPRELEAIILRAAAREPAGRYGAVSALREDLQLYLEGRPVRALPRGWLRRGAKFLRRNARVAGLLVLLAGVLAAAGWAIGHQEARAGRETGERRRLEGLLATRAAARVPYDKGMILAQSQRPADQRAALDLFGRACAADADFAEAWYARAQAEERLGRLAEARAGYARAWALDPALLLARYRLGRLELAEGRPEEALAHFTAMTALDPGHELALLGRAWVAFSRNEHQAALELCARLARACPALAEVEHLRARILGDAAGPLYDPAAAIAAYTRHLEREPQSLASLNNRGQLELRRGRFAAARADFDRCLELEPDYFWALKDRAWARAAGAQDFAGARADLARAAAGRPGDPWVELTRALVADAAGEEAAAAAAFDRAVAALPDDDRPLAGRALFALRQGRLAAARADFGRALALAPAARRWLLHHRRGLVALEAQDQPAAEADFRRALELAAPAARAHSALFLARLASRRGEAAGARALLAGALEAAARGPLAGCLRWRLGEVDASAALAAAPDFPERLTVFYHLGLEAAGQGQSEAARAYFQEIEAAGLRAAAEFALAARRLAELPAPPPKETPAGGGREQGGPPRAPARENP